MADGRPSDGVVIETPLIKWSEQRKVHQIGGYDTLEHQMCGFTGDFERSRAGYSPDRVDALVWALTELSGPVHWSSCEELRL